MQRICWNFIKFEEEEEEEDKDWMGRYASQTLFRLKMEILRTIIQNIGRVVGLRPKSQVLKLKRKKERKDWIGMIYVVVMPLLHSFFQWIIIMNYFPESSQQIL